MSDYKPIFEIMETLDKGKIEELIKTAISSDFIKMEIVPIDSSLEIFVITHGEADWEDVRVAGKDYLTDYMEKTGITRWSVLFLDEYVKGGLFDE